MGASDPVLTRRRLDEVVEEFFYGPSAFVIDVETVGTHRLDPRRNEVVWVQMATAGAVSAVIPCGHPNGEVNGTTKEPRADKNGKVRMFTVPTFSAPPAQLRVGEVMEALRPLFWSKKRKVGANVKFDLETMGKYWGDLPPGPWVDLQMIEFLLNENFHEYKLEKLVERRFGVVMDKSIGVEIEKHPFSAASLYCHYDARREWLLYREIVWRLRQEGRLHELFWDLEVPVLEACGRMETRGILMDRAAVEEADEDLDRDIAEVKRELYRIAGRVWNVDSNPQKQEVFYGSKKDGGQGLKPAKRTKAGAPSCDKDALEAHAGNPLVDAYAQYGELTKIRQYTASYLGTGNRVKNKNKNQAPAIGDDGRVHANFKPAGARTGRFSCSEPNIQNIPRPDTPLGKRIRSLFITEPGRKLLVADYSQIEYVVLAHFSQDPGLIRYFDEGLDFHQAVASRLLRKPIEEVTKVERTLTKTTSFCTVYGGGVNQIAVTAGVSLQQASEFRDLHRKMLPKVYQFTADVVSVCRSRKPPYVETLLGRRRRLPTIHARDDGVRMEAERQAVNSVIQGSAADINKRAMVRIDRMAPEWMWMLLNVHDEFVVSVPEDRVSEGAAILEDAMVGPGIGDLMDVQLRTDVKVVDRWSEAKD